MQLAPIPGRKQQRAPIVTCLRAHVFNIDCKILYIIYKLKVYQVYIKSSYSDLKSSFQDHDLDFKNQEN